MSETGKSALTIGATSTAADMRLLADDVACMLFPKTGETPSEELQASVRLALKLLVSGIEAELGLQHDSNPPKSWDMLCRSGLLREPALIDYCLARTAESRIRARLDGNGLLLVEQLPARLLHHQNPLFSEAARNILIAESQSRAFDARGLISQLPLDLMHMLAWRIVAVFKTEFDAVAAPTDRSIENMCQSMLAGRNDGLSLQTGAAKLVYFLPEEMDAELADPAKAGLAVFVANVAARTGVAPDTIYRFADCDHSEPFLVLMRACGFAAEDAGTLANLLRGARADDGMRPQILDDYSRLPVAEAAGICLSWAAIGQSGRNGLL